MEVLQDHIDLIRRHTNYTSDEVILEKLQELSTPLAVISDYIKNASSKACCSIECEPPEKISINQEIYRQIRERLKIVKK